MQSHLSWRESLRFVADGFAEPLSIRGLDVVVVDPAFVAGVVGRVDVDALDLAGVVRQQRLERVEVVAVDDEVVVERGLLRLGGQALSSDRPQARGTAPKDGANRRTACP